MQKSKKVGFCLSLNILRFSTLPYFYLLDWRIILEGVKMTPLSAVCISLISSAAWRFVGDGTSWDEKVTEFQAEHSRSVSENLRCLSRVLGCSNYNIQGIVSPCCHKQRYLPVAVDETLLGGWESDPAWSIRFMWEASDKKNTIHNMNL